MTDSLYKKILRSFAYEQQIKDMARYFIADSTSYERIFNRIDQTRLKSLKPQVRKILKEEPGYAHGMRHSKTVSDLAQNIAIAEMLKCNCVQVKNAELASAAGLLHDIGRTDNKDPAGHSKAGTRIAYRLLDKKAFSPKEIDIILNTILYHDVGSEPPIDLDRRTRFIRDCVYDADKLDIEGVTGLLRFYAYVGEREGVYIGPQEKLSERLADGTDVAYLKRALDMRADYLKKTSYNTGAALRIKDKIAATDVEGIIKDVKRTAKPLY